MSGNNSSTGGYMLPIKDMTPNDAELASLFQQVVAGITGLDPTLVRPRWQTIQPIRPAPTDNWAAVGVADNDPLHRDPFLKLAPDGLSARMQRHWKLTVLVSFYGPNAGYYSGLLADGLYIAQNREQLETFGIKIHQLGDVSKTAELVNTQWYGRADVAIEFVREIDRVYPIESLLVAKFQLVVEKPPPLLPVIAVTLP